ncbi:MAG TPA: hypothetical protein VGR11_01985 [Solirubrobacteraceae bacterium]|nr:hypothetical protein [Solirubrobacteraceae bacterium]
MWIAHGVVFAFVFALFSDGRFLSSRWRAAAWLTLIGCVIALPGLALGPTGEEALRPPATRSRSTRRSPMRSRGWAKRSS